MKVNLPEEYDSAKISEILSKVLTQLEATSKDKKLKRLTTIGAEVANDLSDLESGLYVNPNDNVHKLNVRSQGRNWSVALTEET